LSQPDSAAHAGGRAVDPRADDAVLVAAARAQPEAFTFLYDRYAVQVYSYCYLKLGSRDAAEDAMSEVFLKALTDLNHYRGGAFGGWLLRIAQYTIADTYRRQHRRGPTLPIEAAGHLAGPEAPLDELAAAASDLERLRAALRQLPADQRAVLELQLADLNPREIATALGRSLNAVRLLRLRAVRAVRPLLDETSVEPQETQGAQAC
jgi:RNA polymerase sigma-70 factor (ECF subfamily)